MHWLVFFLGFCLSVWNATIHNTAHGRPCTRRKGITSTWPKYRIYHNALHAEALNRAGYARCHVFCVWRWSHFAARVKRWCSRVYGPQTRNRLRTRRLQCRWRQCCCKTLRREPWKGSRSEADHGNSKDCTKLQCHRHQPKRPCLGLFYPQNIVPASRNIRTATHHVHSFP